MIFKLSLLDIVLEGDEDESEPNMSPLLPCSGLLGNFGFRGGVGGLFLATANIYFF